MTAKEVATVLRKFPKNTLNNKDFSSFTEEDFKTIKRLQSGKRETVSHKYFPKINTIVVELKKDNKTTTFETIGDLLEHFNIKSKNQWKNVVRSLGYEVVSETVVYRNFQIDRKKMIEELKGKYPIEKLAVMTDSEIYTL